MWLNKLRRMLSLPTSRGPVRRSTPVHTRRRSRSLGLEQLETRLVPSTLTVTNLNDSGAGSLRAELASAHSGDTIQISSSLAGGTLTLTSGSLAVSQNVSIVGSGETISGNNTSGVFNVSGGVTASLSGLSISDGNNYTGGGIFNAGTLTLTNCTVANNTGTYGGGIDNAGTLTMIDCTIANNTGGEGGGIYDYTSGTSTVSLFNCTVYGNSATDNGGGVESWDLLYMTNCTVTANHANTNGGSGLGGGIWSTNAFGYGTFLNNTIVDGNYNGSSTTTGDDVYGSQYNVQAKYCIFGQINYFAIGGGTTNEQNVTNPGLGTLTSDGGPTQTVPLLAGSPALNAGSSALAVDASGNPLTYDQRGVPFARVTNGSVDIGAFQAQNIVVSTASNENDGNYSPGHLSLIEAVELADTMNGGATITFDPTVFSGAETITLTSPLVLSTNITIQAPAAGLTLSGNNQNNILQIDTGVTANLSSLSFIDGNGATGGAILNQGTLNLQNSTFRNDTATAGGALANAGTANLTSCIFENDTTQQAVGGAILNNNLGTLTLTDCTFTGNTAATDGGAIDNVGGTVTVTDSTFTANIATDNGGAIESTGGTVTVTGTTFTSNKGQRGGAIDITGGTLDVTAVLFNVNDATAAGGAIANQGIFSLIDSTLYANEAAGPGGGILNISGTLQLTNDTVTGNEDGVTALNSGSGSGVGGGIDIPGGTVTLANTIIAGNLNASTNTTDDVYGIVTANYSLIGNTTGTILSSTSANDLLNVKPDLGTLGNYGGLSETIPLLIGSPAFAAGSTALAVDASGNPLTYDQRGYPFARTVNGAVDLGAYEGSHTFMVTTTSGTPVVGKVTLEQAIQLADNNPLPGANTITFDPTVFANAETITLTGTALGLTGNLTINGPSAGVNINANGQSGVFVVAAGATVSLNNLTIDNGSADNGGGIDNNGTLALIACSVINSSANVSGAGIYNSGILTLTDCTLNNDFSNINGGGIYNTGTVTVTSSNIDNGGAYGEGGGIFNSGTLTLLNSALSTNGSGGDGANLFNSGTLTVSGDNINTGYGSGTGGNIANEDGGQATVMNSTLTEATIAGNGGGVYNDSSSTIILTSCNITYNVGSGNGGDIYNAGTLTLTACTTQNGGASDGGAIFNTGTLTVTSSSISAANASNGTGLANEGGTATILDSAFLGSTISNTNGGNIYVSAGTVTVVNSTLAQGLATNGGNLYVSGGTVLLSNDTLSQGTATTGGGIDVTGGAVSLANTLVAGNTGDVVGIVTANYSLIGDTTGLILASGSANNVLNVNAGLGYLTYNGGPTETYTLLAGSSAIDAGSNALAVDASGNPLTTDQRGAPFARIYGSSVDIGAFEYQSFNLIVSTTSDENDGNYSYGHLSLREAVELASQNFADPNTITFDPTVFATAQTITLTDGPLSLNGKITIDGPAAGVTIAESSDTASFTVSTGNYYNPTIVTLSRLTLDGGGISNKGNLTLTGLTLNGGGITSNNTLTLSDCTISGVTSTVGAVENLGVLTATDVTLSNNLALGNGGGLNNLGTATLNACNILNNSANNPKFESSGGGIANQGYLTLSDCTVSGNFANGDGGGIFSSGNLTINGSTLTNNSSQGGGGGLAAVAQELVFDASYYNDSYSNSTTTVTDSVISDNRGGFSGGGIYCNTNITVTDSTLNGNQAYDGAAINNYGSSPGYLTLTDSTLTNNTAIVDGGGLTNYGTATVTSCTIDDNIASYGGGGIENAYAGTLSVVDSTLAYNQAGVGGAIANGGGQADPFGYNIVVTDCTLYGNTAAQGSALYSSFNVLQVTNSTITANIGGPAVAQGQYNTSVTLANTIIDGNFDDTSETVADDLSGPILANYCLIGSAANATLLSGSGNNLLNVTNPGLGALADNGGPTETCNLLSYSPAIDAGSNALAQLVTVNSDGSVASESPLTTDQNGPPRIVNGTVDIGAVEYQLIQAATSTQLTSSATSGTIVFGQSVTFTATISSPTPGTPTGTVDLYENGKDVASTALGSNGQATFSLSGLDAGNDTFQAIYLGDNTYRGSLSGDTPLQITPATPTLVIPSVTVTFDGTSHGTTAEAYGVGGVDLGPVSITYNTSDGSVPLHAGTYTATATFAADQDYTSVTGTATITINQATPTVVVQPVTVIFDDQAHGTTAEAYGVGGVDLGPVTVTYNTSNGQAPVQPGTYLAYATFAGDQDYTSATGTADITIKQQVSQLVFSGLPSSFTAGTAYQVTITGEDSAGDVATGYSGTLHFTSSDAQAVLPPDTTLTDGTATVTILFKTAGTQTLTATDTVASTLTTTQTGITVNPGAPATLVFLTQPSTTLYGQTLGGSTGLRVELLDAYGNQTHASGPVTLTLSSNPGNGVLGGTVTVNAVNGIATFGNLNVSEAGTGYVLTASSPGLSSVSSQPFTITALPAGIKQVGNVLYIVGGTGYDYAQIRPTGSSTNGSTGIIVQATLNNTYLNETFGPGLSLIRIYLNGGGASVQMTPSISLDTYVSGGNGYNYVQVGNGDDTILVGTGGSALVAGNGNDVIRAGDGYNYVQVGNGNDVIAVGNGGSAIMGGNGADVVLAGNGSNFVMLGNGNDVVALGTGMGMVMLGRGNDVVAEGSTQDYVWGLGTVTTEPAPSAAALVSALDSWLSSPDGLNGLRQELSYLLGPLPPV